MTYVSRYLRIGYTLGIVLLLAGIVYFFAANWGGLGRLEKIALSAGLAALLYGCSYLPARLPFLARHQAFLSNLLLLGGAIAFGVAVMLIGQTYNSHADSYFLFLIWSVPAILFSFVVRLQSFYVLAYILLHLSAWLYFFPTSLFIEHSDIKQAVVFAMFALANLFLFSLVEMEKFKAPLLKWFSFLIFHIAMLALSNSFVLNEIAYGLNAVTIAGLAGCFYYFGRVRLDRLALSLTALAASAFAVLKFAELAEQFHSELFFVLGIVFVALLLTGNVLFFRYVAKLGTGGADQSAEGEESKTDAPVARERDSGHIAARVVSLIVTIVGVTIGTISLIGLVVLVAGGIDPEYVLCFLSLLFIVSMIAIPRLNDAVRYTVLAIGYIVGLIAAGWIDQALLTLVYALLAAGGWLRLRGRPSSIAVYFIANVYVAVFLFQMLNADFRSETLTYILIILSVLNGIVYGMRRKIAAGLYDRTIHISSLFFGLLPLFWLTFMEDIFPGSYWVFNAVYFVLATLLVFYYSRQEQRTTAAIAWIAWFAYVAYKYYDLIWSLLHKSIALFVAGLIVMGVTVWTERALDRKGVLGPRGKTERTLPYAKLLPILLIIALQFVLIGWQTVSNERLLSRGESIKLELQPLDPRSMLQGDYVRLNYVVSTLPRSAIRAIEESGSSRVQVVLAPDSRGLYIFKRLHRSGMPLADGEVMLNGRYDGWQGVHYGIESFFVPEGTGREVERTMRFAHVRVSAGGNALLERLSAE